MFSKKQLLQICLPSNIGLQILCALLAYYFLDDYFAKYATYSLLGIVLMFVIVRFLVPAPISWSVEKHILFPPATRWFLLLFLPGLTVLSLLAQVMGYHKIYDFGLAIQIGAYLGEYSLILAAEKKGE